MCNILLDIFSTNEAIRQAACQQVEAQKKTSKKQKKLPYPADSHYETLNADLSLLDAKSKEYKMILNYFNKTKYSGIISIMYSLQ